MRLLPQSPNLNLGRRLYPDIIASNNGITDPIERIIADALALAGIAFKHEMHPDRIAEEKAQNAANGQGLRRSVLDFKLENGPYIEVKQYSSDRSNKQLATHPNVILIQGRLAAYWFAEQILSPKSQIPQKTDSLFKRCISVIKKVLA